MNAPIPLVDRRRRKRILTLRNFGAALIVLVVVVAGLNIRSEMRDSTGEDFGRLYQGELKKAPVVEPSPIVEREVVSVDEAASADPFSIASAAREQYLGSTSLTPEPVIRADASAVSFTPVSSDSRDSRVRIVGGPDGVELVREERKAPVLGGGFGRE
ncbi:MAG TPA: hypothetical protein VFT12_09900 [Thermoanaerobaculia bacterium]|nr:hypothetical protein [Thermoanaerobaculia bacterium]